MRMVVGLLVAAPVAAGSGVGAAFLLPAPSAAPRETAPQAAPAQREITLPAIVTNLAAPPQTFVRLQAALVLDDTSAPPPGAAIADDMMAYLRTLTLDDLRGAGGLVHLRDDLSERARIRSNGAVKRVLFHELVVQ